MITVDYPLSLIVLSKSMFLTITPCLLHFTHIISPNIIKVTSTLQTLDKVLLDLMVLSHPPCLRNHHTRHWKICKIH